MFLPKVEKLVSNVLGKQANSFGATVKSINNFFRKFEWIFSLKWIYLQFYEQTKIIIHIDFCDQISDKGKTLFFCCNIRTCLFKNNEKNNAASIIDIKSSFKSVWFRCYVFDYFVLLHFKLPDRGPKWLVGHLVSKSEHLIL